jgi:hypothetical protein
VAVSEVLAEGEQAVEPGSLSGRRPLERIAAAVETCLIIGGLAVLVFGQQRHIQGDGQSRLDALNDLLQNHHLSTVPYSLIGPLFAAALWYLGKHYNTVSQTVSAYNTLLFLAAVIALVLLLIDRLDYRLVRRFLLLLIAGTMIAPNLRDFYGETFTATTVGVGLLAVALPGTTLATRVVGWVAVVLGVANTPAALVGLGLACAVLAVRRRKLRYLVAVVAALALIMGEAWLRYDNPLHSDYVRNAGGPTIMPYSARPGFSYPFLLGVLAILFSFGRGLLWFMPGLFLPVRKRLRTLTEESGVDVWTVYLLWTAFSAGLVLVYARWWAWYGGLFWGPRFFLIAILPASLALAVRLVMPATGVLANLATLGALVLSGWVAADSVLFGGIWAGACYADSFRLEALCHFTPDYSQLWFPFVVKPTLTGAQQLVLAYYAVVLAWLAAPLLLRIGQQAVSAVRTNRWLFARDTWHW